MPVRAGAPVVGVKVLMLQKDPLTGAVEEVLLLDVSPPASRLLPGGFGFEAARDFEEEIVVDLGGEHLIRRPLPSRHAFLKVDWQDAVPELRPGEPDAGGR